MSDIVVVDASVAIQWFVDEPGNEAAFDLLNDIKNRPRHFVVPELFFNEMLAVLCRIVPDEKRVVECLELLEDLGFHRLQNGEKLTRKAIQLAKEYALSGYDAIYAAAATVMNGQWVTCDEKAHRKIAKLSVSRLI